MKILDMNTYKRKDHFEYFRSLAYPYVGVTVDVDITSFFKTIKEKKYPFFLSFLWCVNQACNEIPQFRQRIVNDSIVEYEYCHTSHTVSKEDETYAYCTLDARMSLDEFIQRSLPIHNQAKEEGNIEESAEEAQSLIFISTLPWISYSSLIQPVPIPADSNPRVTWGKYKEEKGKILMPVSTLCHHALVDGKHLADFYQALENKLNEII